MTHRTLARRVLFFPAVMLCLSAILQLTVHSIFPAPTSDALGSQEASWVGGSAFPMHPAGQEEPGLGDCPSFDPLSLAPGLPGTPCSEQRRSLAADRATLAQGFPAEIFHPPIGIL
jgi:hypothetical protein